jgi:hypothetical protein
MYVRAFDITMMRSRDDYVMHRQRIQTVYLFLYLSFTISRGYNPRNVLLAYEQQLTNPFRAWISANASIASKPAGLLRAALH